MRTFLLRAGVVAALATAGHANALTVLATDVLNSGPQPILGSTTMSLSGSAALGTKTINSLTAVGVTGGASGNEIDINEWMTASFSAGVVVSNVQLAFLYDGPEYNDGDEKAKLTATLADNTTLSVTLEVVGSTTANASGGSVVNLQPADNVAAALWSWSNPFGNALVTSIKFESLAAANIPNGGSNTDYSLYSVTAVPEPETYALMIAGLAALGFVARRRRQQP